MFRYVPACSGMFHVPDFIDGHEMTCKKIYTKLLSIRSKPPTSCEKRLLNFAYQKDDLRKLYLLPIEVTKEVKLSMFQFKIIHNILCTKSLLFKMKKEDSPTLPFLSSMHASHFVLEGVSGLGLAPWVITQFMRNHAFWK